MKIYLAHGRGGPNRRWALAHHKKPSLNWPLPKASRKPGKYLAWRGQCLCRLAAIRIPATPSFHMTPQEQRTAFAADYRDEEQDITVLTANPCNRVFGAANNCVASRWWAALDKSTASPLLPISAGRN